MIGSMTLAGAGHMEAAPLLMMTASGLKSLEESQEEIQINEDLRYPNLATCVDGTLESSTST